MHNEPLETFVLAKVGKMRPTFSKAFAKDALVDYLQDGSKLRGNIFKENRLAVNVTNCESGKISIHFTIPSFRVEQIAVPMCVLRKSPCRYDGIGPGSSSRKPNEECVEPKPKISMTDGNSPGRHRLD